MKSHIRACRLGTQTTKSQQRLKIAQTHAGKSVQDCNVR